MRCFFRSAASARNFFYYYYEHTHEASEKEWMLHQWKMSEYREFQLNWRQQKLPSAVDFIKKKIKVQQPGVSLTGQMQNVNPIWTTSTFWIVYLTIRCNFAKPSMVLCVHGSFNAALWYLLSAKRTMSNPKQTPDTLTCAPAFLHLMICRCDCNAESEEATQTH